MELPRVRAQVDLVVVRDGGEARGQQRLACGKRGHFTGKRVKGQVGEGVGERARARGLTLSRAVAIFRSIGLKPAPFCFIADTSQAAVS